MSKCYLSNQAASDASHPARHNTLAVSPKALEAICPRESRKKLPFQVMGFEEEAILERGDAVARTR